MSEKINKIKEFRNHLFEAAKKAGFTDYEVYYTSSTTFEVQIFEQEIKEYKISSPRGLSFRGTYNNKVGYAYTEKISNDIIEFLVNSAKNNALIKETEDESLFEGSPVYPKSRGISAKLVDVADNEKIEWAKKMEAYAKELDKRIISVDYCAISDGVSSVYISNSLGLDLYNESGSAVAYIMVRAKENDETKVGLKIWGEKDFSDFNPKSIATEAVDKAIKKLGASSIKTGDYDVLIENKSMVSLLSAFITNFFAENVQKGLSLLKGKLGTQIATSKLTIHDNIVHPNSLRQSTFDSEGVAVMDKTVVENGVLKTYLYSIKSANNEGRKSTGNGFKGGFKSTVATDINNFFIEPGKISFEQLTKDFSGILVTAFQGLHSGTNNVSGDFSLQADGLLYENGKILKSVEQITVAGNFYNLLNDITEIADDIYFSPFGGGVGSPTIAITGLKISGE